MSTCYSVPKKGDLVEMAMTPLKNAIEMEKVGVFWKIQHKCSKIGIKMFKLMEKWLRIMNLKFAIPSMIGSKFFKGGLPTTKSYFLAIHPPIVKILCQLCSIHA